MKLALLFLCIACLHACTTEGAGVADTGVDAELQRDVSDRREDVEPEIDAPMVDGGADASDLEPDIAGDASGDADSDAVDVADASDASTAPTVSAVYPTTVLSGAFVYVEGANFADDTVSIEDIEAYVSTFSADGEQRTPLEIVSAVETQMILLTPPDFAERIGGYQGLLELEFPHGRARWLPFFGTDDATFSGKGRLGQGVVGNVYRMVEGADRLPDLSNPCEDPRVLTDDGIACPFTSVVSDDFQIEPTDWERGFPGLSFDLREWFAIRFAGQLHFDQGGVWEFRSCSDDGSKLDLFIAGGWRTVVDNDGLHQFECETAFTAVDEGWTDVRYDFFQGPRTRLGLSLERRAPDSEEWREVPSEALRLFDPDERLSTEP